MEACLSDGPPVNAHDIDRWWRRTRREFMPIARRMADQPIVYVEIGVWGGAASQWVCQNVLTHPYSLGFGIDPYDQSQEKKRWNVEGIRQLAEDRMRAAAGDRYQWIREPSSSGLLTLRERLQGRKIDLLYIDGLHEAPDVVSDFVLAWPMLRTGSLVIFDDYDKQRGYAWPHVRHACAAIEIAYQWRIKPIHLHRQYAVEVIAHELPGFKERHHPPAKLHPSLALPDYLAKGGNGVSA